MISKGAGTGPAGTAAARTKVEAIFMNFIISDIDSADSEIIQSVNLNMLRIREQDAARKGTRCCAWVGANGNEQF